MLFGQNISSFLMRIFSDCCCYFVERIQPFQPSPFPPEIQSSLNFSAFTTQSTIIECIIYIIIPCEMASLSFRAGFPILFINHRHNSPDEDSTTLRNMSEVIVHENSETGGFWDLWDFFVRCCDVRDVSHEDNMPHTWHECMCKIIIFDQTAWLQLNTQQLLLKLSTSTSVDDLQVFFCLSYFSIVKTPRRNMKYSKFILTFSEVSDFVFLQWMLNKQQNTTIQ